MDVNSIIQNFDLPAEAVNFLRSNQSHSAQLSAGVTEMVPSHVDGVGVKFFIHAVKNEKATEAAGYDVYDEIEMCQRPVSRYHAPVEQVRFLPEGLLAFNREGKAVGGKLLAAYQAFKAGKEVVGFKLRSWDEVSPGEVKSLEGEGVYTVEQLAETRDDRISHMGGRYIELKEKAVSYVNSKDARKAANKAGAEIAELKEQLAALQEQIASGAIENKLVSRSKAKSKSKSKSKAKAKSSELEEDNDNETA